MSKSEVESVDVPSDKPVSEPLCKWLLGANATHDNEIKYEITPDNTFAVRQLGGNGNYMSVLQYKLETH